MTTVPLSTLRHSASHILAQAVLVHFPTAKLGIGPAIDDGFYYDFDLPRTLSDEDLKVIEKTMKKIIKEKQPFSQYNLPKKEAIKLLEDRNQTYKVELINDLDLDEYSFYENGPFLDLCKGPHCEKTNQLKAIKLLKVSGAYWRGSEKNKMLQRIYGTAFYTKDELNDYLKRLEEAKRRDHRTIGKECDLFSLNQDIGTGLILWHPKGAMIRHIIEDIWKKAHFKHGYQLLYTPHVGKADLWKTSGHLENYQENMYSPMPIDDQDYFIRPMNCPFHILIYQSQNRSYRQLPIRYAELGTVYRYERSGVLHGLFRVRGFTQDDAHIICTPEQVHQEIIDVLQFCKSILDIFGFSKVKTFISTRPEEKAVGDLDKWKMAEDSLVNAVKELNIDYEIDEGGGAFYGPKIDLKIEDAIGREWQCSTIQFDFNLPEKFNLSYINSEGKKAQPIMIHRALLGSLERFFGILIEHYEGWFPTWLAPVQVKILGISQEQSEYCKDIEKTLKQLDFRVEIDQSQEKLGYKIRSTIKEKVPYMIIIGKKEVETNTIGLRSKSEDLGSMTLEDFINRLKKEVKQS